MKPISEMSDETAARLRGVFLDIDETLTGDAEAAHEVFVHRDEAAGVPYLRSAATDQVLTFDDPHSIQQKLAYLKSRNLRGVMVWALGFDADTTGSQPLLNTIGTHLNP